MDKSTCNAPECTRPVKTAGTLCKSHAQQLRRRGWVGPLRKEKRPLESRFWEKVDKTDSCWVWTAGLDQKGYGRFRIEGEKRLAHIVSWIMVNGEIPAGMLLDHICQNKSCVNPGHLRLATNKQNSEYRSGPARHNKSSGIRNVYKKGNGWAVAIRHNYKLIYFGTYSTVAEAEAVAIRERARLFSFPEFTGDRAA